MLQHASCLLHKIVAEPLVVPQPFMTAFSGGTEFLHFLGVVAGSFYSR